MGRILHALAHGKVSFKIVMVMLTSISLMQISCSKDEKDKLHPTIGLVTNNRNGLRNIEGFKDKMTELGYQIEKNINYINNEAPVKGNELVAILDKMVKANVDLIFTAGTPTGVAAR